MIPVIWYSRREKWDMDILDLLCPTPIFHHMETDDDREFLSGAVVVIAGTEEAANVATINEDIAWLEWVVLIVTSDEQSLFPWRELSHPNMRIYIQYPRVGKHDDPSLRFIPIGAPSRARDFFSHVPADRSQRLDWSFSGQVTHKVREDMVAAVKDISNGRLIATTGFSEGLDSDTYYNLLASSKLVLCPSGPQSADSFRTWEALEAGAIPIVDDGPVRDPKGRAHPDYPRGFWNLLLGSQMRFLEPIHWELSPEIADLSDWPAIANKVSSQYQVYKRDLRTALLDDIADMGGPEPGLIDDMTVLMPTSPTPSNPSTAIIEQTISSIRQRTDAEILLMIDGVRPELEHRRDDYNEYVRRLLWLTNHEWANVTPLLHSTHQHQVAMTRHALTMVRTPLVLFIEHDTPLVGNIPWSELANPILRDQFDVIRLYPEKVLQPAHAHMFGTRDHDFISTSQWSQRPHLAKTSYYEITLHDNFTSDACSMIEDRLHGAAQDHPEQFRIAIYAPEGDIQRSGHLDARQSDSKYEETFRY